jgi:hypothetical protein
MPETWPGFDGLIRTRACTRDAHPGRRMTVPWPTWSTSCTCPGAEQERQRLDEAGVKFPDVGELWDEGKRRSRAGKAAYEAARARAAGQSRAEIRKTYIAELSARNVPIPPEQVLDASVERIAGNPLPAGRVLGESLVQMGKGIRELSRLLRHGR